jgi:site-specific DNA-methyltransferase (adenine-specific)
MQPDYELINADAIAALRGIADESIDFIFADPPYFLSNDGFTVKSGKAVSVNKGEWDKSSGFAADVAFHKAWISECLRVMKPNATLAISGTYHSIYQCGFIVQEFGCRIINDLIWFKPNGAPALAGRNFTASHETVIWVSKSKDAKHIFNYESSKTWDAPQDKLLNPGKQMRSVWSIPTTPKREKSHGTHPTQKPLELLTRLISICTSKGDLVLDPFCGSGTTGVAAISLGRKFVGIDLDNAHIELAKRRIGAISEGNS